MKIPSQPNSKSGYLCELKQILVDFLRAFNRGEFLPGS